MERITLQHTDLNVSRICFGTMTFGGQTDERVAARMVDFCLDHGVNFLDTANAYTGGESERMLGRLLRGRRDKVVLASKLGNKVGADPDQAGLSRAAIRRGIDESLQRLQTDYLDIYYLHLPDRGTPIEESLGAMDELVRNGKVRYVASSNYAAWQMVEMFWLCDKNGWARPWIAQPMYNLIARAIEQEYLEMCARFGVSTVVYNPLAGGLLTGKQKMGAPLPGTRFDSNQMYLDRYWHQQQFEAVERLKEIAAGTGRSLTSFALNWLYRHTAINCVILGASRAEHLEQNIAALQEGGLPDDAVREADQVWNWLRGTTPKYNR